MPGFMSMILLRPEIRGDMDSREGKNSFVRVMMLHTIKKRIKTRREKRINSNAICVMNLILQCKSRLSYNSRGTFYINRLRQRILFKDEIQCSRVILLVSRPLITFSKWMGIIKRFSCNAVRNGFFS